MISPVLLPLLLAVTNPCGPLSPRTKRDGKTSQAYLQVARDEESKGALDVAKLAYAEAVELDVTNARARAALARLCALPPPRPPAPPLNTAIEQMSSGDREGAMKTLREIREHSPSADAALLEGVLSYELERDADATLLLLAAQKDPALAPSATLFLGLIALRTGDTPEAERRFQSLRGTPDANLRASATSLLRLASREGRLVLSASAEGGYDSNSGVAPSTGLLGATSGDGLGGAAISALLRPWLGKGFFLAMRGGYRSLLQQRANDTGLGSATVGWQFGGQGLRGSGEYQFEAIVFGQQPYVLTHGLTARAQLPWGRALFFAEAALQFERFVPFEVAGFSGTRPGGRLTARWQFLPSLFADLDYGLARDFAQDPALSYLENVPGLRARWSALPTFHLSGSVEYRWRNFAGIDPDLLVARADGLFEAGVRADWDVSSSWTLYAAVWAWNNASNVPELSYARLVGTLGISFTEGFW